jgi:hypothetical protein
MRFRQYDRLLENALRRIPAHSPVWTDHRQSDPGVTLVQLFAWVAETLGVRPDAIPRSARFRLRALAARLRRDAGPPRLLVSGGTRRARQAAAGFVADRLGLALRRIDVRKLTRKYIGETEKNLREQIAAADPDAVILLFDEADALFGRRTAVKDSHDRYANQAVAHLWHGLDRYEGLIVVTTKRRVRVGASRWRGLRLDLRRPGCAQRPRRSPQPKARTAALGTRLPRLGR